jgi:DNA-binding protein HU-beta
MNKQELIKNICDLTGVSGAVADGVFKAFVESVTEALRKGDEVKLIGFGTFSVKKSEAKIGRNPRTGASLNIKASVRPKFSAGKALKEELNNPTPTAKTAKSTKTPKNAKETAKPTVAAKKK